jgi:hypothetical protein
MAHLRAARRTHKELRVRIAHRLKDFLFLPYKIMSHPSVNRVFLNYVHAYYVHEDFQQMSTEEAASNYCFALARLFDEGRNVTRFLGHARRDLLRIDPECIGEFDAFLDRFFFARMGTHLIGSAFLSRISVPEGARQPHNFGVLQAMDLASVAREVAAALTSSSPEHQNVPVEVDCEGEVTLLYIPSLARRVLREVLSNAITATANAAQRSGLVRPKPIRVSVKSGRFGAFLMVQDQGGGIDSLTRECMWEWRRPTDAEFVNEAVDEDPEIGWEHLEATSDKAALLPAGFGMPLARLTARYFGGNLQFQTLDGHGTSVYFHVPELQDHGLVGFEDVSVSYV